MAQEAGWSSTSGKGINIKPEPGEAPVNSTASYNRKHTMAE
jgi:hypothetical protein